MQAAKKAPVVKKQSLQEQMLADAMQCRTESLDATQPLAALSSCTSPTDRSDHLLELESVKTLPSKLPSTLLNIARKPRIDPCSDTPSFSLEGLEVHEGSSTQLAGGVGGIEELD